MKKFKAIKSAPDQNRAGSVPTTAHNNPASQPRRIQLSRRGGWRKPANTTVVSRPSRWGNPFKATATYPVAQAVADYERWLLTDPKGKETLRAAKQELRGRNPACWCKPGSPCHGDVLLRLLNDTSHTAKSI